MNIFDGIANQFEQHQLFRRLLMTYACCLILYATVKSFELSLAYPPSIDLAAVLAAIQVPVVWLTGFLSKLYWGGK